MTDRISQAEWDRKRAEVKAAAAPVVKAEAEAAKAAKAQALGRAPYPVPSPVAQENTTEQGTGEEEVKPYTEWTNAELAAELEARELSHSGNKEELVARLEESDNAESA